MTTINEVLSRHGESIKEVQSIVDRLEREGKDTPEALAIIKEMLLAINQTEAILSRMIEEIDNKLICSVEGYGPYHQKCNRLAKWVFTGDGKPYCGLHARRFLESALRPVCNRED